MNPNAGPLERAGIHITQEAGEELKKNVDAQKQILDSIGTASTAAAQAKALQSSRLRR